jgi:hypothetical protein
MPKTLLFLSTLLLSAAWMQAQDSQQYPQTPSSQNSGAQTAPSGAQAGSSGSQSGSAAMGQTKVQGCLHGSGGNYTLTDSSGNTYQLQGDTSKLTEHNGHEVQITGTTSGSMSGSSSSSMSGSASQPTLTIQKVKHMSKTCSAGGMSK